MCCVWLFGWGGTGDDVMRARDAERQRAARSLQRQARRPPLQNTHNPPPHTHTRAPPPTHTHTRARTISRKMQPTTVMIAPAAAVRMQCSGLPPLEAKSPTSSALSAASDAIMKSSALIANMPIP